jgi:DNA-binding beta-propeller fold protein YncE
MDDARFHDELRRYWDAIARSGAAASGDLEPELAATIRRLHALPDVPAPDPDYARRLRQSLDVATSAPLPLGSTLLQTPNGHTAPKPGWQRPVEARGPETPRWRYAERWLAAAALLLVLAAGLVASWQRSQPATVSIEAPLAVGHFEPLWQSTGGPEPILYPAGLAVDPQGNLWVVDGGNDRFQIFAPDGTFIETWGTSGAAEGQFNFFSPAQDWGRGDIAFDAAGNFYVADAGNHRIQKFAPDRSFLLAWGSAGEGDGQFLIAKILAVSPDGTIYVCDEDRGDIQAFDDEGRFLRIIGGYESADGKPAIASSVAVDGEGFVWVTDRANDRIVRLSPDGDFLDAWGVSGTGQGELFRPDDLAIDTSGFLYVLDEATDRLQFFAPDGRILAESRGSPADPLGLSAPNSIAISPEGTVYVSTDFNVQGFRVEMLPRNVLTP